MKNVTIACNELDPKAKTYFPDPTTLHIEKRDAKLQLTVQRGPGTAGTFAILILDREVAADLSSVLANWVKQK